MSRMLKIYIFTFHGSRIEAIKTVNTVCCLIISSFGFHIFSFIRVKNKKGSLGRQLWKTAVCIKDKVVFSAP